MNALTQIKRAGIINIDTLSPTGRIQLAVAWDALSENTKTAYQKAWKRLDDRGISIADLTDESLALIISQLSDKSRPGDTDGLSPATFSLTVAAVKWYFKHIVKSQAVWTVTDKRMITIKRDSENRGNGQVDGLGWAAGVEGFISGHSLRVGSAVSLAQAGASVVEMQEAGRWKSPQMPAHYARVKEAEKGAVARYRYKKG